MPFSVRLDAEQALKDLRAVPKRLSDGLRVALEEHGDAMGLRFKRERFGVSAPPWQRNPTPDRLRSRSGALRESYATRVLGSGLELRLLATVGNARTAEYAQLQEEGGTIRPRKGKYLTVPLEANYTPTGRLRLKSAGAAKKDPLWQTHLAKSRKGKLIIFAKRAKSKKEAVPFWVLVKEVKVKGRLGFKDLFFDPAAVKDREDRVNAVVARVARST